MSIPAPAGEDAASSAPTDAATSEPTDTATSEPTDTATSEPTDAATSEPTDTATSEPTDTATSVPTDTAPTDTAPTDTASPAPTDTEAPAISDSPTAVEPSAPTKVVSKTPAATETDLVAPLAVGPLAVCGADYAYILQSNGTVAQYSPTGSPVLTTFGGWSATTTANGLSISADGSTMYAFTQGATGNTLGISSILRYSATTGVWESIPGSSFTRTTGAALISGAINPVNGRYIVGGASGTNFQLYEYDPVTNLFRLLGTVATGGQTIGDMVFDSAGNLYIAAMSSTSMTWYIVSADAIASAAGGTIARAATTPKTLAGTPTMNGTTGIAFKADGSMYLSSGANMAQFDPSTGVRIGSTVGIDATTTDLASCEPPVTLTLQKFVTSRFATNDQFTLTVRSGASPATFGTATTSGAATGLQSAQAGPLPVVRNGAYQVVEASSGGSLANYSTTYSCTSGGTSFASGITTTGSITIPSSATAANCVYTNTPLTASVVIHKTVTDFAGQNPLPGVGWTLGAAFTAAPGTVTRTPTATTQVSNASGDAVWSLKLSTAATRVTAIVSETQRPGYDFVSGSCLVTSVDGSSRTITLPNAQGAPITGIAPGDAVACTITNKPVSATCDVNGIYGLDRSAPSKIWSIDSAAAQMTSIVTTTGTDTLTNALAVGAGFQEFWFVNQTDTTIPGVSQTSAIVYHVVGGVTTTAGTVPNIKTPNGAFIMGAYNPATGVYYFGTLSGGELYIYGFNTLTGQPIVGSVGRVALPSGAFNGDFVFDAAGRLFVVTDGALLVVTDTVPTTGSTTPPLLASRIISNLGAVSAPNSVAFGPDGYLYVGAGAVGTALEQIAKVNPASGAVVGTWQTLSPTTNSIRDFASCASPQVIRLQKDLPNGRIVPTDQFALAVTGGGLNVGNTGLTTGTETGIQNQEAGEVAGPVIGLPGNSYTITETASGTTNLTSYSSSWACVDQRSGTQIASGSGSTGQFTAPAASGNGADILCTFTNKPPAPEIELIKVDAASPTVTLAGATFQLWKDVNGNGTLEPGTDTMVGTALTTSAAGQILWTTGLVAGQYLLQETAAPPGYDIVAPAVHAVTLAASRVTVTVTNAKRTGTVTWSKTDASATALAGSEWSLIGPTGASSVTTAVIDCVGATAAACASATDKDQRPGFFSVSGLAWGNYTLTETKAPAGFVLDSTPHTFSIGVASPAQLQVDLGAFVNQQQPPLTIPLTGGLGADGFLLGGGGALLALLTVAFIRHRRGQRLLRATDISSR
ncbi:SpaA isopeptide-forming pilin-related protein [Microbacterium sp. ZW T5_56]|uniref:SpaA isopeptide-forming pilin-related protein n=1 Tax=Microbacterium sp. ZW T5_56 TaxID=3378081 RepID=UPI0038537084